MTAFFLKKLAALVIVLAGISLIAFTLTKALPGDPVYTMVGERSSPDTIKKIRKEIGSDRGLAGQYLGYLLLLSKGELGRSYFTNREVLTEISEKLPHTLGLAGMAMLIAVPCGTALGFIAALRRGRLADRLISGLSVGGLGIPVFWSGLLLMLLFSLRLRLLPPSGTGGIRYLLLPAMTLALPAAATLVRVTRVTVLDIFDTPYIRTARAKGLTERRVRFVHILRNALVPIITVIGLDLGSYLNGAVLTETIFGWDGVGRLAMEAITKRDYPVIMGCILVGTVAVVVVNLLADLLYAQADPRIRLRGSDR